MPKSSVRRQLVLTRAQYDYLRAEAKRLGVSVAEVVRRIVDRHRDAKEADRG